MAGLSPKVKRKCYGASVYFIMLLAFFLACYFILFVPQKGVTVKNKSESGKDKEKVEISGESVANHGMAEGTFTQLFHGYNSGRRPYNQGNPVLVSVEMMVSNVFNVAEVNNEFSVEIYFRQYWRDERVALENFNFTKSMFLSSKMVDRIWIPSTYFVRSKKEVLHKITTDNVLLQISPKGDIFYSQRLSITSSCVMDLKYFPHDRQECKFIIESYAYPSTDVIYRWHSRVNTSSAFELLNSDDLDLPSFNLEEVVLEEGLNKYTIGSHSYLIAHFRFKRRLGYFLIETYVPSCIIVAISWVSFWISPDSAPARVSLGITTVLTMTTISSAARQSLPKVSYVKAIDWFLLACLVFVFGALIEFAFVSYNATMSSRPRSKSSRKRFKRLHRASEGEQKELTVQSNEEHRVSLCDRLNFNRRSNEKHSYNNVPPESDCDRLILPLTIDRHARRCFPLAFVLFNVVYWSRMWLLN